MILLTITAFAAAMQKIVAQPRLAHATVGLEVYDLGARRALYRYNGAKLTIPASTTKLITEGATLSLLGPTFRWTTPVYRTGPIDAAGALHGDLVLVGTGDPNLSQRVRPGDVLAWENEDHAYGGTGVTPVPGDPLTVLRELAREAYAAGVRRIDGAVRVDDRLFGNPGIENGTGVTLSSIVVNDNIVDLLVTAGKRPGDPLQVSVSPQTSYVHFVNATTTGKSGSDATIDTQTGEPNPDGSVTVTIVGSLPPLASALLPYPVPSPRRFAQAAFQQALRDAGIAIAQTDAAASPQPLPATYPAADLVASHVSPPLEQDVIVTLKVSQNLHASLMPYEWAAYVAHARVADAATGLALERRVLANAGLDLAGASQDDGEGIGDAFSPDFIVRYLAWAARQPWFADFKRGLPVMGVDGTLADVQRTSPAHGKVFAKTGTDGSDNLLTGGQLVDKGLAGYTTTRSGRRIAFAFYVSQLVGPHDEDTAGIAGQMLGALATAAYLDL